MTSQLIDPSRELAREASRLDDGRFGPKVLDEVDLDLPMHDADVDHYDDPEDLDHDGFSLERTISWWRGLIPAPRTASHDDLRASVAEEAQEQALVEIEDAREEDPARKKWHQRFLDTALKFTAPAGHFTMKQTLKTALTKGGLVMLAILSFAVPAEYAGRYGLGVREDAPRVPDTSTARLIELSTRYRCSENGLPEGVIPNHAIIRIITRHDGSKYRVVSFAEGWEAHVDKTDNKVLAAVCHD